MQLLRKCDALRDLVAFVQFKKREKHPWRSVNFNKVPLKLTLHGCFSHFLNCANGTKSCNATHMYKSKGVFPQSTLCFIMKVIRHSENIKYCVL